MKNSKKQTALHIAVERYSVNVLQALIDKIREDRLASVLLALDEDGEMAVHIAANNGRSNLVNMLEKCAQDIGIESEMKNSRGLVANDILEEQEKQRRAAIAEKEKEKEEQKKKKALEKVKAREQEEKSKEVDKHLQELQRLKKRQEQAVKEEDQRRAPFKLLMAVVVIIILLYFLLKIGVATGATKRATKSIEEEIGEL